MAVLCYSVTAAFTCELSDLLLYIATNLASTSDKRNGDPYSSLTSTEVLEHSM